MKGIPTINNSAKETKQIVVVGAGNWVREQYAKALKPYQERKEAKVFIIYDTSYAKAKGLTKDQINQYNKYTLKNVKEFSSWGVTCLDLANPENKKRIKGISPYAVFVVTPDDTHCDTVEEWIDRAENIYVEKPFDIDYERIRKLRSTVESNRRKVETSGFDHYLVRANQFNEKMREYLQFDEHMEGYISEFRFHMLETTDRGMVERSASLQSGIIMDMASHTPAMVLPFGDPNTIRLDSIKAGIYEPNPQEGVTTSGRKIMRSGMETFAEIKFTFTSIFHHPDPVKATACVGKCVGKHDKKFVEVSGGKNRDRKVRLDLANFVVDFTGGKDPGPVTSLFPNPVYLLIREVMAGRASDSLALFDPRVGQDIVARLNEWRRPVKDHLKKGNSLQGYIARSSLRDIISALNPL